MNVLCQQGTDYIDVLWVIVANNGPHCTRPIITVETAPLQEGLAHLSGIIAFAHDPM
jgi:hypothetical protein